MANAIEQLHCEYGCKASDVKTYMPTSPTWELDCENRAVVSDCRTITPMNLVSPSLFNRLLILTIVLYCSRLSVIYVL